MHTLCQHFGGQRNTTTQSVIKYRTMAYRDEITASNYILRHNGLFNLCLFTPAQFHEA